MKQYIQRIGGNVLIAMQSTNKNEILERYYSYYNWRATDGDLHWMNEDGPIFYGYIWTTEEKLSKYLFNVCMHILAMDAAKCSQFKALRLKGSGRGFKAGDELGKMMVEKMTELKDSEILPNNVTQITIFQCKISNDGSNDAI